MKTLVTETINELFDIELSDANLTSSYEDLGLDNLDIAESVMKLEDKLNLSLDGLYYVRTIKELIDELETVMVEV